MTIQIGSFYGQIGQTTKNKRRWSVVSFISSQTIIMVITRQVILYQNKAKELASFASELKDMTQRIHPTYREFLVAQYYFNYLSGISCLDWQQTYQFTRGLGVLSGACHEILNILSEQRNGDFVFGVSYQRSVEKKAQHVLKLLLDLKSKFQLQ